MLRNQLFEHGFIRAACGRARQVLVQHAWQIGQELGVARCLCLQLVPQALRAHLVQHPFFQKWLGRAPEVKVGVELAAQSFDIEQRLLQQHQLRLNLHLKAARGLEQAHQHHAQRNFRQRAVKVGLAHGANGGFKFFHPRVRWHPARLHMQGRHTLVVAAEKGQKVLRQIFLVELGQRANDAKVQRDIAPEAIGLQADHDVSRVHVRMEETITKHLGKENGHAITRQLGDVNTGVTQTLHLTDGHALHALHHHHIGVAVIPVNLGDQHQIQPFHIAAQLRGIGGFTDQIQLVMQIVVELGNDFSGLEALAVAGELFHPAGHHVHQRQVFVDDRLHAGAQHLDSYFALAAILVAHHGEMHLRDGGAGHGLALKAHKNLIERLTKRSLNGVHRNLRIKRRHTILQLGQLFGHIGRHQVAAGGQHLTELHEDGPQLFQRLTQAYAAGLVELATKGKHAAQLAHCRMRKAGEHQLVQPISKDHPEDGPASQKTAHGCV